ncbi:MAG: hypothetical protein RIQ33_1915 [Bacteroidota bacterium]|jgi:predicted DNA-binding protein (MmcQ/YjbR family)
MNLESIREYCLQKEGGTEHMPFGPSVAVYKVNHKMFCLISLDEIPTTINVKCDPEYAIELREKYTSVIPGYHMNKKYWNTIIIDGSIPSKIVKQFIDDSYQLIVQKGKKK